MASFTFNTTRNPLPGKRERLPVGNTAVGITPTVYTIPATEKTEARFASAVVMEVFDEPIHWTIDGSTPVAGSVGFTAQPGDFIYLDATVKVKNFRAIRSTSTSAELEVVALFGA